MRVAIISNSHVNMLKLAAMEQPPSWTPVFFGAPADKMNDLERRPDGKGLYSRNAALTEWLSFASGGLETIDYDDYDAFVLVGMQFRSHRALQLFGKFQPLSKRLDPKTRLISEAAFRTYLRGRLTLSSAYHVMKLISERSDVPVVVVPAPLPGNAIAARAGYRWMKNEAAAPVTHWINDIVFEECRMLADSFGYKTLIQPASTIGADGLTKPEYGVGARRLKGTDYGTVDFSHMNAAFGGIMLNEIGQVLQA